MKWKFWIQEKLYCTSQEATAIVVLVGIVIIAHSIRIVRANMLPFDDAYYAETDSLFKLLSARADSLDAVDTLFTGFDYSQISKAVTENEADAANSLTETNSLSGTAQTASPFYQLNSDDKYKDVELWVVKDTLEKPIVQFPLNINVASEKELQALPRIGPSMAKRIIAYRSLHPFEKVRDLLSVRGIGPKTMDQIEPLVTVSDSTNVSAESSVFSGSDLPPSL